MQARGSTLVDRSPEEAFSFVADAANDHLWRSHLVSSRGRATAVGDVITQMYTYNGRSATIALEVSEIEPPKRLAYVVHEPTRIRFAFQFTPEGGGCRVSMSASSVLSGAAAMFEGRIQAEAEKLIRTDLGRLKLALAAAEG